jgi:hypothetical protein
MTDLRGARISRPLSWLSTRQRRRPPAYRRNWEVQKTSERPPDVVRLQLDPDGVS